MEREIEIDESVKTLLITFSKHVVGVLLDLMRKKLQNQDSVQDLRSVHFSTSRSAFIKGGLTPCHKNYVRDGNLFRSRSALRDLVQHVYDSDLFRDMQGNAR